MSAFRKWFQGSQRLVVLLVAVVLVAAVAGKLLFRDRPYVIHVEGELSPPARWKVKDDFFSKIHANLGLKGLEWMVRHDGTVWQRRDGNWIQLKDRTAKSSWKAGPDGKYALDVELLLPKAPKSFELRLHRRGCATLQVSAELLQADPGRLVGKAGPATFRSRVSWRYLTRGRGRKAPASTVPVAVPTAPTPGVTGEEGEGGEAEVVDAPGEEPGSVATP